MGNKEFYVKYLQNQPVQINTHKNNDKTAIRVFPLENVGDLVAAVKQALPSKLGAIDLDELTLHLPDTIARSASGLSEDCFATVDESDTVLDTGCLLSALGSLGTKSKQPLIIKSNIKNTITISNEIEVDQYWRKLSELLAVSTFKESMVVVDSDREVKIKSKRLILFHNDQLSLEMHGVPYLKYQRINLETTIQHSVTKFMDGTDFLGLLIGPTGCGKTHEMLTRAKTQFTIYIDAQSYPVLYASVDMSVSFLKQTFESITNTWSKRNQNVAELRRIGYAFVLARMLFLKHLKEKYPDLSPTQFLIHQEFNSNVINRYFRELTMLSLAQLQNVRDYSIDFQCLFCVDEAHVLVAHLGETIISTMEGNHIQQNGDVNEQAKRGTLSVLLHAIQDGRFAKKVIFAGTSSTLRNIDNFGTFETKPVAPIVLNEFTAWDSKMALNYVSSYVDISQSDLEKVLTDNYRPRILENFVYDLFYIAMNDAESPTTKNNRVGNRHNLLNIDEIVKESYNAVIHRFTRVTIEPLALTIRNHTQIETMLKLLLSSMMTTNKGPINCQLNPSERGFFMDTIGSIYLIPGVDGYSFYEGYVIDAFLPLFENELRLFNLLPSLNLLKSLIALEGKKTTAKGTLFEAVVLADLMNLNGPSLSKVLSSFHVSTSHDVSDLYLPTEEKKFDDESIISERPLNVFLRPSNQFRPDILAFLSEEVCISFGIKIFTSRISSPVHDDNFKSTDPDLFFSKSGQATNQEKRNNWKKSTKEIPLKFSARFLIELPEPVNTVSTDTMQDLVNGKETVIIVITKSNMRKILSEDVSLLVDFITK